MHISSWFSIVRSFGLGPEAYTLGIDTANKAAITININVLIIAFEYEGIMHTTKLGPALLVHLQAFCSHSAFEEPRGTSTVRYEPGVRDITTCSVIPWYRPKGVSAVKRSGATYVCSSDEPAVACAYFLSKMPSESNHRETPVRDTTTRHYL